MRAIPHRLLSSFIFTYCLHYISGNVRGPRDSNIVWGRVAMPSLPAFGLFMGNDSKGTTAVDHLFHSQRTVGVFAWTVVPNADVVVERIRRVKERKPWSICSLR